MAFRHNSEVSPNPRTWGDVDKTLLPREAFANMRSSDPEKKTTWRFPHHQIDDGGDENEMGVYTTGKMYVNVGGVDAAWQRMQQANVDVSAEEKAHIQAHRKALGRGEFARAEEIVGPFVRLSEGADFDEFGAIEIQGLVVGEWLHPDGNVERDGERWLVITSDDLDEFDRNFRAGVMGDDVPIHERHEEDQPQKIQGHIKGTRRGENSKGFDSLFLRLQVTDPPTQQKVREGSLKYFSPSLMFGRVNPTNGERQNVIADGALTERPFLKGMDPARIINLEDVALERGAGRGVGGKRQGDGGAEFCVCVDCGARVEHDRGTPCVEMRCPKCGGQMGGESGDNTGGSTTKEEEKMEPKEVMQLIADFVGADLSERRLDVGKLSDDLTALAKDTELDDAAREKKARAMLAEAGLYQAPSGDGGEIVSAIRTLLTNVLGGKTEEAATAAALEDVVTGKKKDAPVTEPTVTKLADDPLVQRLLSENRVMHSEKMKTRVTALAERHVIAETDVARLEAALTKDEGIVHLSEEHVRMVPADLVLEILDNAPGVKLSGNALPGETNEPAAGIENLEARAKAAAESVV